MSAQENKEKARRIGPGLCRLVHRDFLQRVSVNMTRIA